MSARRPATSAAWLRSRRSSTPGVDDRTSRSVRCGVPTIRDTASTFLRPVRFVGCAVRDDHEARPATGDSEPERTDSDDLIVDERVQPPAAPPADRSGVIRQTLYKQPGTREPV